MRYALTSLYLYLTGRCNLRCRHCWIEPEFSDDGAGQEVPVELLEKAVREAIPLGLKRVKLTGGEPLLREDIPEILDMLTRNDMVVDIETNATLITPAISEKLSELKRGSVSVSLDSHIPAVHNEFRGREGAYSNALRGVGLLRKRGIPFQVICSVYKNNAGDIREMMRAAKELGASSFKINPVTPYGRGDEIYENGENLTVREMLELDRESGEYSREYGIPVYFTIPPSLRSFREFRMPGPGTCHVLNILGILCDGTVSFCGVGKKEKELVMGNIKTDNIKDIWENSPVLAKMREEIPYKFEGLCGRCIFKAMCLGQCVAITYSKTKSFRETFWMCEEAAKEGLFPKSRVSR